MRPPEAVVDILPSILAEMAASFSDTPFWRMRSYGSIIVGGCAYQGYRSVTVAG